MGVGRDSAKLAPPLPFADSKAIYIESVNFTQRNILIFVKRQFAECCFTRGPCADLRLKSFEVGVLKLCSFRERF